MLLHLSRTEFLFWVPSLKLFLVVLVWVLFHFFIPFTMHLLLFSLFTFLHRFYFHLYLFWQFEVILLLSLRALWPLLVTCWRYFLFFSFEILLCSSFSWVSLISAGFCLVAISPCFPHLPDSSLAYFLSFCYLFCFLSLGVTFSSFTLFCSSTGFSFFLIGELW